MAIIIVDNRLILDESDVITGWTSTDGPTVFTTGPTPVEAGGCLGLQASNATQNAYTSITSDDYSLGGSLFIWITDRAAFDTTVNGGIGLQVGDGTNRIAYHVGGSDGTGFRHDEGPVKWINFQIDLANKPTNFTAIAGSEASLNEAAITQVGVYFETIAKSVGGADNCFWDIIRWADNGVGIEFYGGTIGSPENWETVSVSDRAVGNQQAHGIIKKAGAGAYSIQGNINIGDNTSTNDTYINSDGETFLWEDRGQSTNNYYRFNVTGNGTGTTDVNFDDCSFVCPTSGSIDFSDVNSTADVRGTVVTGFDQGILTGGVGNIWSNDTFSGCGQLETTGSDLRNNIYTGYTGIINTSQLYWNSILDPNGSVDGSSFTMPVIATHAIEFPAGLNSGSITITNCEFNGFNASNNVNDSTFNVLATTGALTINISGGSGNISYRSAGCVVTVSNSVNVTLTGLKDTTEVRVMAAGSNTVELAGTEDATTGTTNDRSFTFSLSASTIVDIYIVNTTYENIEIEGYTVPGATTSLPQAQRFDRVYLNN